MNELTSRRCVPCEGGMPAMSAEQAGRMMQQLAGEWRLAADAKSLTREFRFRDFYRTMSFVNALAHIANIEDHHPDLALGYNYCRVTYTTHAARGLSENDFVCAAKIDRLPLS